MSPIRKRRVVVPLLLVLSCLAAATAAADSTPARGLSKDMPAGLVVLLGGEATERIDLARAVSSHPGRLVQCLEADADILARLRREIEKRKLAGKVTVRRRWGTHLPYSDKLVNVLVVRKGRRAADGSEVARVLAPRGFVLAEGGAIAWPRSSPLRSAPAPLAGWEKRAKPWPQGMDSWTHYAYDAAGGRVGRDEKVHFPQHLQWDAGPRWSRSHENISSLTALVSSGGRIFYVMDEATAASVYLPPRVSLIARDAFNGILLWKRPIANWFTHLFRLKSGPHQLCRRLVAVGDEVYVTLGLGAPVSVLDAATGKVRRVIAGSENTQEILHVGGKLVVLTHQLGPAAAARPPEASVIVFEADSGKRLWARKVGAVTASTLAAGGEKVYCLAGDQILCLALGDGADVWQAKVKDKMPLSTHSGPGLQVYKDVVIYSGRILSAFEAATGRALWTVPDGRASNYRSPTRVFAIDDLVWKIANKGWDGNVFDPKPSTLENVFVGFDYQTGKVKKRFPVDSAAGMGIIHHRCYIPCATGKYILTGWPGIEFVDTKTGEMMLHNWIRGACLYGIMPANGLVYAPPNPCACYTQGKLNAFVAVAPAPTRVPPAPTPAARLEKGPAYDARPEGRAGTLDWPTYRGGNERGGHNPGTIGPRPALGWRTPVAARPTAPIVADGRVYLADRDANAVTALDADTGQVLWRFTADGAVDSPPTYFRGRVLFGCRDGYVYCIEGRTGRLQWRFLAARRDLVTVSCSRLESQWPLHGSVTVEGGKLFAVAGKTALLNGGLDLVRLDVATGKQLAVRNIYCRDDAGVQPRLVGRRTERLSMDLLAPDVLSTDGKHLFLRYKTLEIGGAMKEAEGAAHLYAAMGFLDDAFFHRAYWAYDDGALHRRYAWIFGASRKAPGPGKRKNRKARRAARMGSHLAVMDSENVYHFGKPAPAMAHHRPGAKFVLASVPRSDETARNWAIPVDMFVRAMAVTREHLCLAGPVGDWMTDPDVFEGRRKVVLRVCDKEDGKTLSECTLRALPVFDGLAVAGGRVYVSLEDGSLCSFK